MLLNGMKIITALLFVLAMASPALAQDSQKTISSSDRYQDGNTEWHRIRNQYSNELQDAVVGIANSMSYKTASGINVYFYPEKTPVGFKFKF